MNSSTSPSQLKLAYLIDQKLIDSKLDPARVDLGKHANLVRALYSRLVEFDLDGSLRPSLASSFEINGKEITFVIPAKVQTIEGSYISAKDVAFSLIRLLVLKSNRHSSLALFLCGKEIHSVLDTCEGIRWSEGEVKLILKDSKYSKFLLPILASTDFSIVPYDSIAWDKDGLPIENYRNTSGSFYLERDYEDSSGTALLKKNQTHPYVTAETADSILLVNTRFDQMKSFFASGKVDAIPTIFPFSEDLIQGVHGEGGFVHETLPVKIWFLNNLNNARAAFTKDQLLYISYLIKKHVPLSDLSYKCISSNVLFPTSSEGALQDAQQKKIDAFWANVPATRIPGKFRLWVPVAKVELFKNSLKSYSFIEVYSDNVLPLLRLQAEQPHGMIVAMDSTFFEDLSMLNYNFSIGTFGFSKSEAEVWLEKYIQTELKSERIEQLKSLHYSLLDSLRIVPIGFSPYVAVAKKGWSINFSKYYAGSPLWRIKKQ